MTEECEFLEKCGFFINYRYNPEAVKEGWTRLFCDSFAKSEKCERKIFRKKHGKPPPDNMSPSGKYL